MYKLVEINRPEYRNTEQASEKDKRLGRKHKCSLNAIEFLNKMHLTNHAPFESNVGK